MKCPLCGKDLKELNPNNSYCPQTCKMHDGFYPFHYWKNDVPYSNIIEEAYLPPYRLSNVKRQDEIISVVHEHITGKILFEVPHITFTTEKILFNKVKILLLFS